jgi:hypothetical protein
MAGSFDFDPGSLPLYGDSLLVQVYRYDPDAGEDDRYTLVPNVRCESIQQKEGAEPSTAQFSYILDDSTPTDREAGDPENEAGWPTQFEALWPIGGVNSDYALTPTDRIVVLGTTGRTDDGTGRQATRQVLWDGFPRLPQCDVSATSQHVTFTGVGVAARLWDTPIYGRLQREAKTTASTGDVLNVPLPCRFNPDGKPNKTADGADWDPAEDLWPGGLEFPVFMESGLTRDPDPRGYWTLADAAKYLMAFCNAEEEFIENPDFSVLTSLLKNRRPAEDADGNPEGDYFDPSDSSTYTEDTISVRDYDASNRPWPEALHELLGYAGFGMRFVCEDDGDGFPYNFLEIYRKDQDGPTDPKELRFPRSTARLDEEAVDIQGLRVSHDFHGIANRVQLETKPVRYEMSFILAPGFVPNSGDGAAANRKDFSRSNIDASDNLSKRNKYRLHVFDEGGDGHWSFASTATVTDLPDFAPFWPKDDDGNPTWIPRYRPGSTTLFTKGADNKPLKAQLAISTDYANGEGPVLWDGSGTWQVIHGGWELLKDRLGIWISCENPGTWNIGKNKGGTYPAGVVDAITAMCDPTADVKQFYLRLTTTIESDYDLGVVAERRKASPIAYDITRVTDAADHFRKQIIVQDSAFNVGNDDKTARDDKAKAKAHAEQLRAAHEFPPLAGSITIPGVNLALRIGDRVSKIDGRDVSLRTNLGAEQGEAPTYPFVVAVTWTLGSRQSTTYQISDRRAEAQTLHHKHKLSSSGGQ